MLHYVITLSVLILVVILIRAIFRKKIPPAVVYAMWLAVVIRMCIPMPLLKMDLPVLFETEIEESVPSDDVPEITENENPNVDYGTVDDGEENLGYMGSVTGGVTEPYIPPQGSGTIIDNPTQGGDTPIGNTPNTGDVPLVVYPNTPSDDPVQGSIGGEEITPPIANITPEVPYEDIPNVEPPIRDIVNIDVPRIVRTVWIAGSAVVAAVMLVSAVVFQLRARRDRQLYRTIHKTKVYISESVGGPCLAGLVPSIYLTPENAYSDSSTLTMIHEYTHLRHGDYIWSAVRAIALIVHWWNPLVWIAAILSKHDAELAVDAAITKELNDEKKLEYARIIVDTIPVRGAHAIGLGSGQIKERILMITGSQRNRIIAVILAIAICLGAIGCAFVGQSDGESEIESEIESESESEIENESETETESESETTEPVETPNDFTIEPTEVYELPIEVNAENGEVVLMAGSYGEKLYIGTNWITIDGLYGDATVATIRAGADGEGYVVFACGTWTHKSRPTERRAYFTTYHTYRVVCEGGLIVEVEKVDTITSADVLEYGKPYTGSLDGEHECARAGYFDGLLRYYGFTIDGSSITAKVGAYATSGGTTKNGKFTYDLETGELVANLTYEIYNYETESKEVKNETVTGKLLEYKGFVHFVYDEDPMETLPITFISKNDDAHSDSQIDAPIVNVISNPGGINVQTVYIPTYINGRSAYANIFEFDERYVICVTYDDSYNDPTLYVIDTSLGQIIHEEALTEYGTGGSLTYIDSSVVLLNYYIEEAENRYRRSTEIRIENGAVQVIEGLADYEDYPRCEGKVKSPDGRYTAYNVLDDEAYHGGVDLLCPDGTIKRIKENYVIHMGEGTESEVYSCRRRYSPLGFIDDKHLVIIMGVYESISQYEIYNVETGEFTQGLARERIDDYYNIKYSPAAIIDGYLYLYVWKDGPVTYDQEIIGVGKIDLDGNFTMLAHRDETDGVFVLTEDECFTIHNEVWHMYDSRFNAWSMKLDEFFKSTGYRVTKKFYSADFELLLELEYPYFTLKALKDVYVYGDTCTVITFVDNSNVISASAFETAYRNAENVYSWFTGYGGFEALMEWTTVDGQSYQRCDMLEFDTLAELESITARYFSKDLTDKLMNTTAGMFGTPLYVEENGKLYKVSGYFSQFGYDAVYDYKFERLGYSDGEYSVKVTASFCPYGKEFTASAVCKYVIMDDGSIVFTEFPLMIEELTSFWASLSQIEDSGTTVSREDLSSIYKDVEFTTYTYDESDFYGYTVTIDIPSYCYRYNGVYLEPNTLTNSDDNIYRALLTKYEHSYAEFEAGVDLYRDANIMSIKNRTSVFKDISSENINGFFGYIDKDGTPYCVYAFYFPTDRHGEAIVLYLWQRLGADGNFYYNDVILPIVRSVKIEKESTTQEGGTIYFTSSPTSFLPPEASSRVGDLKFGNSHIITYASDKYGLCVYYSYGLDAESFVMLKTEFEPADIQTYYRSEVLEPELNEDGIVIATVRYFHYGTACYTDVTYELNPNLYVVPGEPNEERIYRTPVWKVVDTTFTLYEGAVASTITGKNGCVEFWHKLMGSDLYLYFITIRDEEHNPTKHFSLYYFDAGNARDGLDLVNIEIPEDVEYDTIKPINYITGGGSMECRFYLELTKDGEIFYVEFNNFGWRETEEHIVFNSAGVLPAVEQKRLAEEHPDIFEAPATIVNVDVTVHGDADCEIIFDEESYESGLFTRFTLRVGDRTVDFEGYQLNYKPADVYTSDITGDGTADYTVVFTWGTGTSFLLETVHVFDGATLREITVSSPEDYLDENLVQSFDEEHYMLEIDGGKYIIKKSEIPFFASVRQESVGTNTWRTFHVNGDGELVAVIGCMVGMHVYVGVIEIEYGYTDAGELRPVHAKYIDTLSLEYGINSYYDSIRG